MAAVLVRIGRVWATGIRQIKHKIHLGRGQRNRWWIDPHIACRSALTVRLNKRTGVAGIGFEVQDTIGVRIQDRVRLDLLIGRQADHAVITWGHLELALCLQ